MSVEYYYNPLEKQEEVIGFFCKCFLMIINSKQSS